MTEQDAPRIMPGRGRLTYDKSSGTITSEDDLTRLANTVWNEAIEAAANIVEQNRWDERIEAVQQIRSLKK